MQKQCIINKEESNFTFACFPNSMTELSEWYTGMRSESISLYSNVIAKILSFFANDTIIMISVCELGEKPNLVSQKKGMKGIFSRYNKQYYSDLETYVEVNNRFSFISVAANSNIDIDTFFVTQIQSIICSVHDSNIDSIMDLAKQNTWDVFIEKLKQYSDICITYCDVGCDGNSIKIHTPYSSRSLNKNIGTIAHNLCFEIVR